MRWLVVLVIACGVPVAAPDAAPPLCTDQRLAAPTFTNMQRLFSDRCTNCHAPGVPLDLTPDASYANLINRTVSSYTNPDVDESCGGILVVPGNPDGSYLLQKLSLAMPCAGAQMPRTEIGLSNPVEACVTRPHSALATTAAKRGTSSHPHQRSMDGGSSTGSTPARNARLAPTLLPG